MPKITLIGAGSTIFAKNLLVDILGYPELAESTIVLHDIDEVRLKTSVVVANRVAKTLGVSPIIESTLDRRESLQGADYAICMVQVGGYRPSTVIDFEIPTRYGLQQTIGDTMGIGGIMRALRTIPVLLDMCQDMEEICPDVTFLNYVNPMVMNCWAIDRASSIDTVGLCHSVPYTAAELAEDINVPIDEINYLVAGINHMAFYLKYERNGVDLYPKIRQFAEQGNYPHRSMMGMTDGVRYELFKHFGYFVTESSEHFSEYVPWFIKRDRSDLIEKLNIPIDEYITRCENQIAEWETMRKDLEDESKPLDVTRSVEYGSHIIHSMETGQASVIYGNVANHGIIHNLPSCVPVEVPCLVDKNGIQPTVIGDIPPHLAALMQTNINVQSLVVEAALTQKRDYIYQAAMLDPHAAAELDLEQIKNMVDDLIQAHGEWLPEYH